ncbi:hypothetical protein [Marinobacterium stanieri]|uniref:Uncharacterized protein n=1 Tax=Marinobacterium stanieri TaxID=49186 RepID=A0A1N6W6P1_9GAMM|nr:hypothetical protein [Marinobacterium stanieri]SIQ85764.1 hypothetical protein SAMN05421647_11012 [Marinobacterium stanieri]
MDKFKYIKAIIHLNILDTKKCLEKNPYSYDKNTGFEIIDYDNNNISCKYFERIVDEEIIIDPFGNEIINSSTRYLIVNFRILNITKNNYLLSVQSPPRNLGNMIDSLSSTLDSNIFISNITLDIASFYERILENKEIEDSRVEKIKFKGISINKSSSAELTVSSSSDAYEDALDYIGRKNSIINNIKIRSSYKGEKTSILISETSLINCSESLTPLIEDIFVDYISASLN